MEKLRYKARVIRLATDEDLKLAPVVCEHCHQTDDSVKWCLRCQRGFHETVCELQKVWQMENSTGLPNISQCELINDAGYCWECQRFDPELDGTSNYQAKVAPWYIEWESHYEDADTMRGLVPRSPSYALSGQAPGCSDSLFTPRLSLLPVHVICNTARAEKVRPKERRFAVE